MNPLVSIIIPTYNRAHLIEETLDSIIAQTYTNWECIVVDDGSTDNTDELLADYCKKDARFQYHLRPNDRPKGANACRNYGFELSKGEYVNWFDSDDLMLPIKLEIQLKVLQDNVLDFSVSSGAEFTNDSQVFKEKWKLKVSGNLLFNHIRGVVVFGTNGPLFKKEFLIGKELFNESLIIRQEWEFFCRLLLFSPKVKLIDEVMYLYRSLSNSIRGDLQYEKIKCKMITDRIILQKINKSNVFNDEIDFLYRRFVLFGVLHNSRIVIRNGKYGDLFYLLKTFLISINWNYFKRTTVILKNKPFILNNFFKSFLVKRN